MKVRVMVVSNTLAEGGAERWASGLICGLDRSRYAVSLVLFRDVRVYDCPDDVCVEVLNHLRFPDTLRTLRQLSRLFRELKPDVVLSNGFYTSQFVGHVVRGEQARWICRISGNISYFQSSLTQRLGWRWLARNMSRAAAIVGNSEGLSFQISEWWPQLRAKISTIPNGVDAKRLRESIADACSNEQLSANIPFILAAGRLCAQKRPDLFLSALESLKTRIDFRACWCGDGPLKKEIERRINETGLSSHLQLKGFVSDLPTIIADADCFVLCSDHEGSPNVLTEAMSLGTPVVSTDCPFGPRELIGADRGYLVPLSDSHSLFEAILKCVTDRDESRARAERARSWVESNLAQRLIVERWQDLINRVVSEKQEWRSSTERM